MAGSGAGYVNQRYGSADPDPYRYQNVTDQQHCPVLTPTVPTEPL